MAYQSNAATRATQRHYSNRTAAAWAAQQHRMARLVMAALWLVGAASLLAAVLASVAGGAWVAVLLGVAHL